MRFVLTLFSAVIIIFLAIYLLKIHLPKKLKQKAVIFIVLFMFLFLLLLMEQVKVEPIQATFHQLKQSYFSKDPTQARKAVSPLMKKEEIKPFVILDVPIIRQLPELPRGCEVTSLAMLLQDAGVQADKMTLAKQIKKDPTPFQKKNGKVYFGNPNDGFVGDMYSFKRPGLGVYHKPIKELAEKYLPNKIIDLTGSDFSDLQKHLSKGSPIWIITNSTFKKLPESTFREWETPSGPIKITYYEHSVVITGYDNDYIYFNDPLSGEKNKKAPKADFLEAWVQMGRQAIAYQLN
jgi:uncharacterized protein YvpB